MVTFGKPLLSLILTEVLAVVGQFDPAERFPESVFVLGVGCACEMVGADKNVNGIIKMNKIKMARLDIFWS